VGVRQELDACKARLRGYSYAQALVPLLAPKNRVAPASTTAAKRRRPFAFHLPQYHQCHQCYQCSSERSPMRQRRSEVWGLFTVEGEVQGDIPVLYYRHEAICFNCDPRPVCIFPLKTAAGGFLLVTIQIHISLHDQAIFGVCCGWIYDRAKQITAKRLSTRISQLKKTQTHSKTTSPCS
jgi:hypothetical protein